MSLTISETLESQNSHRDHTGEVQKSANSNWASWKRFQHLLWREWRNLRWWLPASLALTGMIMLLYILPFIAKPLAEELETREVQMILFLQSMLAPAVFLIGALVGCFANEREESSYQWCNALPIHWAPSFAVKLLCTFVGAILCGVIAWYFAAWFESCLPTTSQGRLHELLGTPRSLQLQSSLESIAKFGFSLFSMSLVCILLARTVASGGLAAVALSILYIVFRLSAPTLFESANVGQETYAELTLRLLMDPAFPGTIFLLLAAVVYRWRWNTGMYSGIWPKSLWTNTSIKNERDVDVWPLTWTAPHAGLALYWLAWKRVRTAWIWLPLAVVVIVLGNSIRITGFNAFSIFIPLGYLLIGLFVGLGSIWSVYGERGGEAESFLAERGVSPTRYWWTRYLVSAIGGTGTMGVLVLLITFIESFYHFKTLPFVHWRNMSNFITMFVLGVHALTLVCLLAGQTFRSWQVAAFAVACGAILMGFFAYEAGISSGYQGFFVCYGLVATAAPLSWWISKATFVQWQPKLGALFAMYVATLLLVVALTIPWVRVWVLPAPSIELAETQTIPPFELPRWTMEDANIVAAIHSALTGNQQYSFQEMIDQRNLLLAQQDRELITPTRPAAVLLRESSENARHRLLELASRKRVNSAPETGQMLAGISDLRRISLNLNEIAFAAMEIGDSETTEVTLRLRRGLLDSLQPVTGLYGFDSIQLDFYKALEAKSGSQALQIVQELHRKQPSLLGGNVDQANAEWIETMRAQFSYLFRHPRGDTRSAMQQDDTARTSSMAQSDELMSQSISTTSFIERANLLKFILPEQWWYSAEEARFRREIGYAYRIFLDYLRTDQLTTARLPRDSEIGELNSRHELFKQIEIWDGQRRTLEALLTRLTRLPEENKVP